MFADRFWRGILSYGRSKHLPTYLRELPFSQYFATSMVHMIRSCIKLYSTNLFSLLLLNVQESKPSFCLLNLTPIVSRKPVALDSLEITLLSDNLANWAAMCFLYELICRTAHFNEKEEKQHSHLTYYIPLTLLETEFLSDLK